MSFPLLPEGTPRWLGALRSLLFIIAIVAVLLMLFSMQGYWISKFATLAVYALAVRGLQLLVGLSGQISLGHGAFFALGAYSSGILIEKNWLPDYLATPAAALACGMAGLLFGLPAVGLAGPYLALATFALALALPQLLKHPLLDNLTGGVSGLSLDATTPPISAFSLNADQWALLLCLFWVTVIYLVIARLLRGPAGLAWMSLRDQPTAAAAAGINVRKWKAIAFGISSAVLGAAGSLNTFITHFVSPDSFPVFLSLSLLVGVAIAGTGSSAGSLLGALFLVFVPDVAEKISQEATGLIYGLLMLACVYAVPGLRHVFRKLSSRFQSHAQAQKRPGNQT